MSSFLLYFTTNVNRINFGRGIDIPKPHNVWAGALPFLTMLTEITMDMDYLIMEALPPALVLQGLRSLTIRAELSIYGLGNIEQLFGHNLTSTLTCLRIYARPKALIADQDLVQILQRCRYLEEFSLEWTGDASSSFLRLSLVILALRNAAAKTLHTLRIKNPGGNHAVCTNMRAFHELPCLRTLELGIQGITGVSQGVEEKCLLRLPKCVETISIVHMDHSILNEILSEEGPLEYLSQVRHSTRSALPNLRRLELHQSTGPSSVHPAGLLCLRDWGKERQIILTELLKEINVELCIVWKDHE
jgi:hypothetical protein